MCSMCIMFSELLSKCESVCREVSQCVSGTQRLLRDAPSKQEPMFVVNNITLPNAVAPSFPKSERFPQAPKDETVSIFTESIDLKPPPTAYSFRKGSRFQQEKHTAMTPLHPNYALIKPNLKNAVIMRDLKQSSVTLSTQASFVSPAAYFIKDETKATQGLFPKGRRFAPEKNKYEDTPLFINEKQVKHRPPSSAILRNPTKKTKQMISIERQEQIRQKMKLIYWQSMPLEIDRLYRTNIGPVLKQQYFNIRRLRGTERRCAIIQFLNKMAHERGGYEQDIAGEAVVPCGVIYRKSTPKPFKFTEMEPGPGDYYPKDDLTQIHPISYGFAKADESKKTVETDNRDYDIAEPVKGQNIIIAPLPQLHSLTEQEITALNRGPGFYDCLYGQVQSRNDKGVLKLQPITAANARENNCVEVKEVNDGLYFPSYGAIDPNVPTPLYKEEANVRPMHLPDKELFPQHWMFYDGDLNKIKAEIAKNVLFSKNMEFNEYQKYAKQFSAFKEYLKRRTAQPEVGQYDVKHTAVDPHIEVINMALQEDKTLIDPIVKPIDFSEGDNLLLNPHLMNEHIQGMEFKKQVGRNDNEDEGDEPREGDRLLLNPDKPKLRIADVKFRLIRGRNEEDVNEEGPDGDRLILYPEPVGKHVPTIDIAKTGSREETSLEGREENVVNVMDGKKPKGIPFSRLSTVRLVPLLRSHEKRKPKKNILSEMEQGVDKVDEVDEVEQDGNL